MRTMMPFAVLAIGAAFANAHADTSPLTGQFTGSGRACYGALEITAETVSWDTSFSRCRARSFRLTEDDSVAAKRRLTFEFTDTASACRFQVISLTHDENSGADSGWEATGYADPASFQADRRSAYTRNAPDMMSCALIRVSGRDVDPSLSSSAPPPSQSQPRSTGAPPASRSR